MMNSTKVLRKTLGSLLVVLLIIGLGLAVPNINVKVQSLGVGRCQVKSPVTWATVTLHWSRSGSVIQTCTLEGASVVFSNDVSGPVNFTLIMNISGYHNWYDSNPSLDVVKGVLVASSGIIAGQYYSLTLNDTPSYDVFPLFNIPEPSLVNATGIITGGQTACADVIYLSIEGIGIGSTNYSPPPVSLTQINITVNNLGNPELRNYVLNFTVSSYCIQDLSKVYVTDSSGNPLYFWAFNDSKNGKIWFWVNYTIPANSVNNITIHLNGTGTSPYFNPNKVFWYFEDTPVSIQGGIFSGNVHVLNYPVSNFLNEGYDGYAVDTNATLGTPLISTGLGPYFLSFYYSGQYIGIGALSNSSFYLVYGTRLTRANTAGNSLGILPSWGPGIYSVVNYISGTNYYTHLNFNGERFFESQWASGINLLGNFVLGQRYYGNPSTYEWIGMRPVTYPFPKIMVPEDCGAPGGGGDYTFTLYFRP